MTEKGDVPMVVGFDIATSTATALAEIRAGQPVRFCDLPDVDAVLLALRAQEDCLRLVQEVCGLPLDPLA